MSDRDENDDAMSRRVEERMEEGAFHPVTGIARKFESRLHPHDRSGEFAQTFTTKPPRAPKLPREMGDAQAREQQARADAQRFGRPAPKKNLTRQEQDAAERAAGRTPQGKVTGPGKAGVPKKPRVPRAPQQPREVNDATAREMQARAAARRYGQTPAGQVDAARSSAQDDALAAQRERPGWGHVATASNPGSDAEPQVFPAIPDLLPGESTQEMHSNVNPETGERVYSEKRKKLHDSIVKNILGTHASQPAGAAKVLFLAGGPASGKSSALSLPAGHSMLPEDAVEINPDEIKAMLPEYQNAVKTGDVKGASIAHEESSDISKRVLAEAMAANTNIIRDGTGNAGPTKMADQIRGMVGAGYKPSALYVNAPTNVAVPRAFKRAQREGRFVPEKEIRKQHKNVSVAFAHSIRGLAEDGTLEQLRMYHTHEERSILPTMFASAEGGKFETHNQGLYDDFVRKGEEEVEPQQHASIFDLQHGDHFIQGGQHYVARRHSGSSPDLNVHRTDANGQMDTAIGNGYIGKTSQVALQNGSAHVRLVSGPTFERRRRLHEASFSEDDRKKLADKGVARPDGSYPIRNARDLGNAIADLNRTGSKPADKAHIIKRAKALGLTSRLPDEWDVKEAAMPDPMQQRVADAEARLIAEAADSLAKASTPEPFSTSKTSNWVAKNGGLPDYIQHVAHGLVRAGRPESEAIEMAIGIVRRWARGGGKVDAGTKAAAAKAIAEWENLKARNAAHKA